MAKAKVTNYNSLDEIKHEGLRDEAEGWNSGSNITCGSAIVLPHNPNESPLEGFYDSNQGQGMVVWDDDMSDWIEGDSLSNVFQNYAKDL